MTSLSVFTFMHWRRKWQPTPVFLPGESQGREPGGLPSMGSHRVGHDWSDLAAAAAAVLLFLYLPLFHYYIFFHFFLPSFVFLNPFLFHFISLALFFSLLLFLSACFLFSFLSMLHFWLQWHAAFIHRAVSLMSSEYWTCITLLLIPLIISVRPIHYHSFTNGKKRHRKINRATQG